MKTNLSLLTVLGKDRSGIIARVTGIIFRAGANLEDITMTILEGEFAMMMVVCLSDLQKSKINEDLKILEKEWRQSFFWKDLKREKLQGKTERKKIKEYLITAIGKDQTGIVHKVSDILAKNKLNITDLNSRILGHAPKALYALALEFDVPASFSVARLQKSLNQLQKKIGIEVSLKPVERIEF